MLRITYYVSFGRLIVKYGVKKLDVVIKKSVLRILYRILAGKSEGERPLGRPRRRW